MGDEYENYRGTDGAIDWGKYYADKAANDQLSIINNQSPMINDQLMTNN